jgi:hypothetical protein
MLPLSTLAIIRKKELAKIGYISEKKTGQFKNPAIFW